MKGNHTDNPESAAFVDKETQQEFDIAKYILDCLTHCQGLECEVMVDFLRNLKAGESPCQAITGAMMDWDLA